MNKVKVRRGSKGVVCPKCKNEFELEYGRFNSGQKGSGFEAFVASEISIAMYGGSDFLSRTPTSGAMATFWKFDVFPKRVGTDTFPLGIECKFRNSWQIEDLLTGKRSKPARGKRKADTFILDWWDTTVLDCGIAIKIPVLVFKKNREKALAIVSSKEFNVPKGKSLVYQDRLYDLHVVEFETLKVLLKEKYNNGSGESDK
jgi:hypothetical protein